MPTHAILGATGGVGSAIVHSLLDSQESNLTINLLVRSRQKLTNLIPRLSNPPKNITVSIFEGSITDPSVLSQCLKDAEIIYQCISGPDPSKKTTVVQDTSTSVVKALEDVRSKAGKNYKRPTVLFNRSSALNLAIKVPVSTPFFYFLKWALNHTYSDLAAAADVLGKAAENNTLNYILLDAPNIFHPFEQTKTGHELFTEGDATLGINYADFGEAAVEVARRKEEFYGKGVGVRATGEVAPAWGPNLYALASGAYGRLSPF